MEVRASWHSKFRGVEENEVDVFSMRVLESALIERVEEGEARFEALLEEGDGVYIASSSPRTILRTIVQPTSLPALLLDDLLLSLGPTTCKMDGADKLSSETACCRARKVISVE